MTGRGRKVILYGSETNTAPCDEHVVVVTEGRRTEFFGPRDEADLNRGGFDWNAASPWWREMNSRAGAAIRQRASPDDLLCVTAGQAQTLVCDMNPSLTAAEIMVGYEGILNVNGHRRRGGPAYCAFESRTHQHLVYGRWQLQNMLNERWYDTVIPNSFDADQFPQPARDHDGYLLFVGRLIGLKGPHVAARIADALGMRLIVAGPGALEHGDGYVRAAEVTVRSPQLEFVGPVDAQQRAELMNGAACLLAPTMYAEPFGGVAVEAMMAGCPVVATDWGAFTETIEEDVSGYRFHTLAEGVEAVEKAMLLDRQEVRAYALDKYSLAAVAPLYDAWFDRLDGLWAGGWDALPERMVAA